MEVTHTPVQEYLENRIRGQIFGQANIAVELLYDCEEQDLPMRIRDARGISAHDHVEGIILMAVDGLIDLDDSDEGLVSFNRTKLLALARKIAAEDYIAAFLQVTALLMQGYKVGPTVEQMMRQHHFNNYTEHRQ
jgi:hypothetical protein